MFLLLLTMAGSQADETDSENMTNKELHDKFQQMMSGQVQDVLNRFEEAMEKIDGMEKTFEIKLDNRFNELLARLPHHHRLHLTHLYNNNNDYLHIVKQPSAERAVSLLHLAKLLVLLLILMWLLLLMRRRMILQDITRMRLIKIRTTCHHQHSNHQVVHMQIMAMVGITLRYEIMTISLN